MFLLWPLKKIHGRNCKKQQTMTESLNYGLFSHFEIFPTKIVRNMILRNTRVSISEEGLDCVLL